MLSPDFQRHIDQSKHNEEALHDIVASYPSYTDWIITVTFYFALHIIQAALIRDHNLYPDKHEYPEPRRSRNTLVETLYKSYSKLYLELYHESRKARYVPGYHLRIPLQKIQHLIDSALVEFSRLAHE